jgi:hypothetical protein
MPDTGHMAPVTHPWIFHEELAKHLAGLGERER